ncbi:MAG: hypothetical protein LCH95_10250 [Proteobacteria bacterium]|nr:hypothetical protein [Pseudomonadota bacterium]
MNSHRHDEETRHALRAALSGGAAAFLVVSAFELFILLADLRGLRGMLLAPASDLSLWHLLWLPACCAAVGFAMGPSVAGPLPDRPRGGSRPTARQAGKPSALFATLMVIGVVLWLVAAWAAGRHASQRAVAALADCGPAPMAGCDPLVSPYPGQPLLRRPEP